MAGVLLFAGAAHAEMPCTYYAAPVESEGGRVPAGKPYAVKAGVGTPDQPIAVADFWKRKLVKPGTVLCLMDGEYRGKRSMIRPPRGQFSGTAGARVEIRAVNDGHVWIDGEFRFGPLRISNQSYWTVSGLNVFNSRGPAVGISGRKQDGETDQVAAHHIVLRRIVAWRDYLPYASKKDYDEVGGSNLHIFTITDTADVLVEDCAGFGAARKIFQIYRSQRVTFRRNWARWDGRFPYKGGNKFAFSCAYRSYESLCENLIATVGGSRDPAAQPADYLPGVHLIATDGSGSLDSRWIEPAGRDVHNIGLRIYGSLAYTPPDAIYKRVTGFFVGGNVYPSKGQKGVLIEDSVASVANDLKPGIGLGDCDDDPRKHPDGCSWELKDDRARAPVRLRKLTIRSDAKLPARIGKDWIQDEVVVYRGNQRIDIYRGNPGKATLCHRYIDGRETSLPLWPWPMQDRIRTATERSSWPTADVMREITDLFGAPPPECVEGGS